MNIIDRLSERGYIKQATHIEALKQHLNKGAVTFYVGIDPTADSMHIGHFVPLMTVRHLQKAGHKPIIIVGGATAIIGDPSGKTDMRNMLSKEDIAKNVEALTKQIARVIKLDTTNGKEKNNGAIIVNNYDWLGKLNYLDVVRDIGVHFSVNRMLSADCFKARLEREAGLSFLEFNYMILQAYDYLHLNKTYGCTLQVGGDDQWSNILAGADLIRRVEGKEVYCLTYTLLTNSEGEKMGKTVKGALWLDKEKCSVFDMYQYFRNIPDSDVANCLKILTEVEISTITALAGGSEVIKDEAIKLNVPNVLVEDVDKVLAINLAKQLLAFEVCKIVHGEEEALAAHKQALAAMSGDTQNMPSVDVARSTAGIIELLIATDQAKTTSEARRLIDGKSISINDRKITDVKDTLNADEIKSGSVVLHRGKKVHVKINLV